MIELTDLTVGYDYKPVFSNVNLQIPQGSFTGIVGPTGSGKSTLLLAILGLVPCAAGNVGVFKDNNSTKTPAKVGYVSQERGVDIYFPATVEQIISMGLATERRLIPWLNSKEKKRVASVAEQLGISTYLQHHIGDISGGQQQRAFLSRALISNPDLLILDEPTTGVDLGTQQNILQALFGLNRNGMTILITTHDLSGIACRLPQVLCFNHGIIGMGTPDEVFTDDVLKKTFGDGLSCITHKGNMIITNHGTTSQQVKGYGFSL